MSFQLSARSFQLILLHETFVSNPLALRFISAVAELKAKS
jgi:hypothetical protein